MTVCHEASCSRLKGLQKDTTILVNNLYLMKYQLDLSLKGKRLYAKEKTTRSNVWCPVLLFAQIARLDTLLSHSVLSRLM
jgi:hypothetical protein